MNATIEQLKTGIDSGVTGVSAKNSLTNQYLFVKPGRGDVVLCEKKLKINAPDQEGLFLSVAKTAFSMVIECENGCYFKIDTTKNPAREECAFVFDLTPSLETSISLILS